MDGGLREDHEEPDDDPKIITANHRLIIGAGFARFVYATRCIPFWIAGSKVELEALYTLSLDALTGRFLETAVLRGDYI